MAVVEQAVSARDREALRLMRCLAAAREQKPAANFEEALLFRLASELVASRSATASVNLARAAEGFSKPASVAREALRLDLVVSLPRFREQLLQQLAAS